MPEPSLQSLQAGPAAMQDRRHGVASPVIWLAQCPSFSMDLRTIFGEDREQLITKAILAELCAIEDAPWGDLKGKPMPR